MRVTLDAPLTVSEVARAIGGKISNTNTERLISGVVTDSREAVGGDLFFAFKGSNENGARYIPDASYRGAISVTDHTDDNKLPIIITDNTGDAILRLASYYKKTQLRKLSSTVGITGSVGKTTVKEFICRLLSPALKIHGTKENFNNLIGMPMTVLGAPTDTEVLILEMGMNSRGEIHRLSECAEPDIGIITNIGTAHIGMLGSRTAISEAKLELLQGLKGRLYVPDDEPLLCVDGVRVFSTKDRRADICVEATATDENGIRVCVYSRGAMIGIRLFGRREPHHLSCLSAALCAATELIGKKAVDNISLIGDDAVRVSILRLDGVTVMNDCYNASLESIESGLHALRDFSSGRRSALLGDVLELGGFSQDIHQEIGRRVAECINGELILIGEAAPYTAAGAVRAGLSSTHITIVSNHREAARTIKERCSGDTVLIKGSHGMELWKAVEELKLLCDPTDNK